MKGAVLTLEYIKQNSGKLDINMRKLTKDYTSRKIICPTAGSLSENVISWSFLVLMIGTGPGHFWSR